MATTRPLVALPGVLVLLTVVACQSATSPASDQPLEVTRLGSSVVPENAAAFDRPQRLVIRTQAEWEATWASLTRQHPGRRLPEVDFTRQMVLLAAAGTKPTGGYSIHIEAVRVTRSGIRASVRTVSPGPTCGVIQMLTHPIDIAIVRRHDARVEFEEKAETRSCS